MGLTLKKDYVEFFTNNRSEFQDNLLNEAKNVRNKIEEIQFIGNIDLLNNAHKLVMYALIGNKDELDMFAEKEGISWASHSLTLAFKLEWVQAIRRTIWRFLQRYDQENPINEPNNFYELERQINETIDQFLNTFFLSYSEYKDQLIEEQRTLVENLSVPIIPITSKVCVLPLIGHIDMSRSSTIEEKVLLEISKLRIGTLVIDLSGIAEMEPEVIEHMMRIIEGANMMGCECVITGLRPEIVRKVTKLGLTFEHKANTKATLQQALEDYFVS
ncbi:anti-anti-sigma regulatory factor [Fictibacillus barbaricus]|uniref:Anti-anti-sigma regulatory factor n=2 Tax=Fictibacillus barbaricus TaxID=182136 RepID=A0ABU1TWK0_9BACL|nr:STAS domain-containing protein [Fictibacillus barbaricus]MDR7071594.1 anti-anti-sigma regulatory factor [Fictibacillus barbaricus]